MIKFVMDLLLLKLKKKKMFCLPKKEKENNGYFVFSKLQKVPL